MAAGPYGDPNRWDYNETFNMSEAVVMNGSFAR
jgi:hypothetical protein